jgi:hypothetical protein
MCLVEADGGFEVFSRTDDARLEVRFFEDEEAAYFYLFGVLAAEAVRSGRLGPTGPGGANGHNNGSRVPRRSSVPRENVSKYLQGRKFTKSPSHPARVCLAGGADGPPLPKQPRRPLRGASSQKHRAYHKSVILSSLDNHHLISLSDSYFLSSRRYRHISTDIGSYREGQGTGGRYSGVRDSRTRSASFLGPNRRGYGRREHRWCVGAARRTRKPSRACPRDGRGSQPGGPRPAARHAPPR